MVIHHICAKSLESKDYELFVSLLVSNFSVGKEISLNIGKCMLASQLKVLFSGILSVALPDTVW